MNFSPNKTPIKVIREGAFGGTYFRDIDSGINEKWYKKLWKEFDQLRDIDNKYYCSDYHDVRVSINMVFNIEMNHLHFSSCF